MKIMVIALMILISSGLFGCDMKENPLNEKWQQVQIRNIERCEQSGGFPIKSVWDNRMTECQRIKP